MLQPDITPSLPDYGIPKVLQRADQTIARDATRQSHAASNGINSSFT